MLDFLARLMLALTLRGAFKPNPVPEVRRMQPNCAEGADEGVQEGRHPRSLHLLAAQWGEDSP